MKAKKLLKVVAQPNTPVEVIEKVVLVGKTEDQALPKVYFMKPVLQRGQLVTWKDERGFGFIKPDSEGKEVFLHITAIQGADRRPQLGDTILYECVAEANGKVRASKAFIQGLATKPPATRPNPQLPQPRRRTHPTSLKQPTQPQRTARPTSFKRPQSQQQGVLGTIASFGFAIALIIFFRGLSPSRSPSPLASMAQPNCTIKGNISQTSGTRYYHLPGMEDYENTVIDPARGEKWFCSEQEAINNGWQKAPK